MVESPTSIVLPSSNRNILGSTSGGRCSNSCLISIAMWIGASIGVMSLVSTIVAPTISSQWVLGSLDPLNTQIPSSGSLEIVRVLLSPEIDWSIWAKKRAAIKMGQTITVGVVNRPLRGYFWARLGHVSL
jgi:hypothetical protein